MIQELPCGCPTIPTEYSKAKMLLMNGEAVFFDDARCEEHENGTGLCGFMIPYKNKIIGILEDGDVQKRAEISLERALYQLEEFNKFGFDFSFGKVGIELENNDIFFVCGG